MKTLQRFLAFACLKKNLCNIFQPKTNKVTLKKIPYLNNGKKMCEEWHAET